MDKLCPFDTWLKCIDEEKEAILATVLPMDAYKAENEPKRLFFSKEHLSIGDLGDEEINLRVLEIGQRKLMESNPKSETRTFTLPGGFDIHVFIDVYIPPSEIMIFGAGHDAIPVANYAVSLGFKTTIIDQRTFYNNKERFPFASRQIVSPAYFNEKIKISYRTYIVVMNHHLEKDQETLKFVLHSESPYIGVLGPRSRQTRMLKAIEAEGILFDEKELERIHSPIGLDIGAVSPDEIALSILSEIVAKKNGHSGGFLRGSDHIHKAASMKELV